jgi:hypothetical protein
VNDRWAIAAYVRVLQLSQYAPVDVVPAAARATLESASVAPEGTGPAGHEPAAQ